MPETSAKTTPSVKYAGCISTKQVNTGLINFRTNNEFR
jgi:hypothetical protein